MRMLTIRKKQLEIFSEFLLNEFKKNALINLRLKFPEQTVNIIDEKMNQLICHGIERAYTYKIVERKDVLSFLYYIVFFGREFDEKPPLAIVSRILKNQNYSGSEKMGRINKLNLLKN
jgi:hypothetical protein